MISRACTRSSLSPPIHVRFTRRKKKDWEDSQVREKRKKTRSKQNERRRKQTHRYTYIHIHCIISADFLRRFLFFFSFSKLLSFFDQNLAYLTPVLPRIKKIALLFSCSSLLFTSPLFFSPCCRSSFFPVSREFEEVKKKEDTKSKARKQISLKLQLLSAVHASNVTRAQLHYSSSSSSFSCFCFLSIPSFLLISFFILCREREGRLFSSSLSRWLAVLLLQSFFSSLGCMRDAAKRKDLWEDHRFLLLSSLLPSFFSAVWKDDCCLRLV